MLYHKLQIRGCLEALPSRERNLTGQQCLVLLPFVVGPALSSFLPNRLFALRQADLAWQGKAREAGKLTKRALNHLVPSCKYHHLHE